MKRKKVWYQILKGRKPKFHRQRIIGNYIVDFYCPELRLAIEIDGCQHYIDKNYEYDKKRTEYIEAQNIYVLRFDNSDVKRDFEYVKYTIDVVCDARKKGIELPSGYR